MGEEKESLSKRNRINFDYHAAVPCFRSNAQFDPSGAGPSLPHATPHHATSRHTTPDFTVSHNYCINSYHRHSSSITQTQPIQQG